MKGDLTMLSAVQSAEAIREGKLTSEALVSQYLARTEQGEPTVKAWVAISREHALQQARDADRVRRAGRATGPLHGVPVGVKDIIDTADLPTQRGSSIFEDRQPDRDARMIERLREAGAVLMGKTATTEMAYMHPAATTNPHDTARTPGGSSSGSAAAVAARHVPLAIGTQTGGSVVRPAAFCGTYGFKPTRGVISRGGVFRTSASLDQIGVFANTLEDAALLTDVLGCYDQTDPASFARPRPDILRGARSDAPVEPDIAWFDLPYHGRLDSDAAEGLEQVIDALGDRVERFATAPQLAGLTDIHKIIYDYEIAANMAEIEAVHSAKLSNEMTDAIRRGRAISRSEYEDALDVKLSADSFFKSHFNDFDAILAPSSTGEAPPLAHGNTGDSVFCLIWTLAGLPSLTLPLLVGENGLPIGVQLIGGIEEDDRLFRTANWMQTYLAQSAEEEGD